MWPFRIPKTATPTFEVNNTIGAGSCVRGDLSGAGGFRIDGTVDGAITADGPVVIGEGGTVNGGVRGRDVVVLGRVCGDVEATGHLEIGATGKVLGDITVQSFRIHKGGVFRGTSYMADGAETPALAAHADDDSTAEARGRTLPPPNGAVPPPPALAARALAAPVLAEPVLADAELSDVDLVPVDGPDAAVSQQRLINTDDADDAESSRRETGS